MADRRDILVNLLGQETVSAAAARAGRGLGRLGDDFDATANDARGLDRQIHDVEQSLRDLSVAYARAGDAGQRMDITRALRQQEAELRRLTRARGQLGDPEGEADGFAARFAARLGSALSKSRVPVPVMAALGAPMAIGLSATIAGAVVGGVGIGGVLGGLSVASKHADVQAAAKRTGDTFTTVMQRSAVAFVPAAVDALGDVRSEIFGMEDDFRRIFAKASTYVAPLTKGVTGFAKNLLPGVEDAVDRAGPVIDELASWGPRLGDMLSDIFSDFADNAAEGASALAGFWTVFEVGARGAAGALNLLAEAYGFIDRGTAVLQGNTAKMAAYAVAEANAAKGGTELGPVLQDLLDKMAGYGQKAETATEKNKRLLDSLNGLTNAAASSRAATMDFEAGLDELTASVQRNGTTMDVGSAKGRANRQVIESLISAAERAGKAAEDRALAEGKSAEEAAAAGAKMRSTYIRDLEAAARKANLSKSAVAAMVAEIKRADGLRARMVVETIFKQTGKPGTAFGGIGGQHFKGYAAGGPVDLRGPKGVDSGLIAAAPGEHMLTAAEVDAAGGHRAVEGWRKSLLSGPTAPAPASAAVGGAGGNTYVTVNVNVPASANAAEVGRAVVESIKAYERGSGKAWRT